MFKAAVPESVLYHLPPGMVIIYEKTTVLASSIIQCADKPDSLAFWNASEQSLEQISTEVQ